MEPKAESEATLSMRGSQRTSLRMPQSGRKTISPVVLGTHHGSVRPQNPEA